jgi:carboxyl-terminal processing protease
MRIRNIALVALITAGSFGLALFYVPGVHVRAATSSDADMDQGVKAMTQVYSLIEQNFADPVSPDRAIYEGAIPGMLRTLDPHSNFLDPNEWREMQQKQRSQYFGVGMEIGVVDGRVTVYRPFPGSPAWNAGMRRGDIVAAVDGHSTAGMDTSQVANMLRGPRGTPVSVAILRQGGGEPVTLQLIRSEIQTSYVDAFWLKPGIAYLGISTFEADNISQDMEAGLKALGEQSITGLVLDLRGNPGGLLTEAVAVAGHFLRNGQTVVSHRGRAEQEEIFRAKAQPYGQKYPIVVLVDRHSASASEIVSGALQDHDRAWILGDNTFGKGLVQTVYPLVENTGLALTTAKYYTPSGRLIQRDYSNVSFFDYYYRNNTATRNVNDVKSTDSGRVVYGGGGISPDEKYMPPKLDAFETELLVRYAPSNYAHHFIAEHKAQKLPANWQVDEATMNEFHNYILDNKLDFTEKDFTQDYDWVRRRLQSEIYKSAFSIDQSQQYDIQTDPEVEQGIDALPKAEALMSKAKKVIAERMKK